MPNQSFHPEETASRTFVDVVLPLALPGTFTYHVPEVLVSKIQFGVRVEVQFGKNKLYSALVVKVHQDPPSNHRTKAIADILDEQPVIFPDQWKFWKWLSEYYVCTPGEVMNAALPTHLKLASETRIILSPVFGNDFSSLNDKEYMIAEALTLQDELSLDDVRKILNQKSVYHIISRLLDKKVIYLKEEIKEKYQPKSIACLRLKEPYASNSEQVKAAFEKLERSHRQVEALMAFLSLARTQEFVRRQDVLNKAGVDYSVIKSIEKKGIWEVYEKEVSRFDDSGLEAEQAAGLSTQQIKALKEIEENFEDKNVVLLHGVTGSGKTRIYIELIQKALEKNQQVLYLLPEIALTTQIVSRLQTVFGDKIAVYHSKMSNNERVEIWKSVADESKPVVLGARSALMLPFRNLKLVVVDEEHDTSFKQQDPAPRYHGRDAAIYLAHLSRAKTLLGTATPAVESYYNAKTGKYGLVEMNERFGGMDLPELVIADAKQELKERKLQAHFTQILLNELGDALTAGRQAILFQNRRGYAPTLRCSACNWHQECIHCDVSLTYHKFSNNLQCHYCGYNMPIPKICPACGSRDLKLQGFGTEKIEDELKIYLPDAKTGRMDLDTVRTKNAHTKIINDFEEKRIDILVGTQMVTKGLDFENVGVVGVISADQLLQFPDFRAGERAFQLIAQVAGRAGRKNQRGKVIIQSMNTAHPVLREVLEHDYKSFFEREILERQSFNYPPFSRLIRITLKHKTPKVLNEAAKAFYEFLRSQTNCQINGPAVPYVSRVRGLFLLDLLLKMPAQSRYTLTVKRKIEAAVHFLKEEKGFGSVRVVIDVDPY